MIVLMTVIIRSITTTIENNLSLLLGMKVPRFLLFLKNMLESAQIFIISTAFFTLQAEHKQRNGFLHCVG